MLNLEQIIETYPSNLQIFKKNILREYLQYKILEIIFDSPFSNKLSFLGGTALRIVYGSERFSEDLDFDNFNLEEKDFENISLHVKKKLIAEGLEVNIKNVHKGAFRCYVKIPKILFANQLSNFQEEQILIQLDSATHNFSYIPERKILNKFDIFTQINVTPLDLLLSQKIFAAFNRKRMKGRDFYDIIFLFSLNAKPNYKYLHKKIDINNQDELNDFILQNCAKLDFNKLAKEVEPFLFFPKDKKKVELFFEYFKEKSK